MIKYPSVSVREVFLETDDLRLKRPDLETLECGTSPTIP
jgi:hypothetical protein